jgi:hypothetical protein
MNCRRVHEAAAPLARVSGADLGGRRTTRLVPADQTPDGQVGAGDTMADRCRGEVRAVNREIFDHLLGDKPKRSVSLTIGSVPMTMLDRDADARDESGSSLVV